MNVLGRLLMELRDEIGIVGREGLRRVQPLAIPNFLLDGHSIGEVSGDDTNLSRLTCSTRVPLLLTRTRTPEAEFRVAKVRPSVS